MQWFLYIVGTLMWLVFVSNHGCTPSVPPMSPPSPPALKTAFDLLGLAFRITTAEAQDGSYTFPPNKINPQPEVFYPHVFIEKHNIKTSFDVENFDSKATQAITACTKEILERQIRNQIARFEERSKCLNRKGYGQNERAYIGAKHGNT